MKLGGNKWHYGEITTFVHESLRRARIARTIYCKHNRGKEIDNDGAEVEWYREILQGKIWALEELLMRLDEEYEKETGFQIPRGGGEMRTLNLVDVNFLKDMQDVYKKYGIELEYFIPEFDDKKDYLFEAWSKDDYSDNIHLHLIIHRTPNASHLSGEKK